MECIEGGKLVYKGVQRGKGKCRRVKEVRREREKGSKGDEGRRKEIEKRNREVDEGGE